LKAFDFVKSPFGGADLRNDAEPIEGIAKSRETFAHQRQFVSEQKLNFRRLRRL
jgi:hypothetical protein